MSETVTHADDFEPQDGLPVVPEEVGAAPPEAQQEAAPEPQETPRQVPLAELIKERNARKAAAEEAAQLRRAREEETRELAHLRKLVEERLNPPQAQTVPDVTTDPVAHFAAKTSTLESELAALRAERRQQTEAEQRAAQDQDLVSRYVSANNEYKASAPDWDDAYAHFTTGVVNEAKLMGANDAQAYAFLHDMEKRIAQAAFANGENPGRNIYELAKARGFRATPPKPPAAEQIETMRRGQSARSVGAGAGGETNYAGMTLAQLVALDDAAFDAVPEPVKRRLMGG